MRKVFVVIPSMGGGGAERVMLQILKNLDRNKFEIRLILFEREGELLSDLPPDITVDALRMKKSKYMLYGFSAPDFVIRFAKILRKDQPDAILSFMWYTNLVVLLARLFSGIKCGVLVSERYGLSASYEGLMEEFLRRNTIRFFYPKAETIIVNAEAMGQQLRELFHIHPEKIEVIYNPLEMQRVTRLGEEKVDHIWFEEDIPIIIGIGRLTLQKGFSYLIKAIHILTSEGINCRLIILGKGPEDDNLRRLAVDLNVADRVAFLGFQKNPYKYLSRSTIFTLSSLYEGLPNVLLEALALGVSSIATRCPTGPEEIVTDGVNGILVPPANERVLSEAIKKLLLDEELRARIGEAGRIRAEYFRADKVIKEYERIIHKVCAESAER